MTGSYIFHLIIHKKNVEEEYTSLIGSKPSSNPEYHRFILETQP
jgi:hypothetical protein